MFVVAGCCGALALAGVQPWRVFTEATATDPVTLVKIAFAGGITVLAAILLFVTLSVAVLGLTYGTYYLGAWLGVIVNPKEATDRTTGRLDLTALDHRRLIALPLAGATLFVLHALGVYNAAAGEYGTWYWPAWAAFALTIAGAVLFARLAWEIPAASGAIPSALVILVLYGVVSGATVSIIEQRSVVLRCDACCLNPARYHDSESYLECWCRDLDRSLPCESQRSLWPAIVEEPGFRFWCPSGELDACSRMHGW